ncbi:MAG: hypothetical protein IJM41_07610 [Bacteroidales bacterium]|nr:hypothetical protein [Bacteroidales bacterium]
MKRLLYIIPAILLACASCDEWDPVFTFGYDDPGNTSIVSMEANASIADLKALYEGAPLKIDEDIIISGLITTSDLSGNIYRSFFIQDETGAIEVKIGKSSLYGDYKIGQRIWVKCEGLTLGNYGRQSNEGEGMLQLGFEDPTGEYETSYIDIQYLINTHIFKGAVETPLAPEAMTEDDLKSALKVGQTSPWLGKYVTLKGLKYANEIFVLLYLDSQLDKKSPSNRCFLSDSQWGVDTWAMSKELMSKHLEAGEWDTAVIGSGDSMYGSIGSMRGMDPDNLYPEIERAAYTVSQYFKMSGGTEVQIRTSGFCRFSDEKINSAVLSGDKSIDVTGILSNYQGSAQFTVIDIDGIKVN